MLYGSSNIVFILIYNDGFVWHPQGSRGTPFVAIVPPRHRQEISDAPAVTEH